LLDQKNVNIIAYLRHVHPPPRSLGIQKTVRYGVAILSDGKHSEVALKLWNDFSNTDMIERLKENVGKMIECTSVVTKHCTFLDTMTLNTTLTSRLNILTTKQAETKTFRVTPSANEDTQDDDEAEDQDNVERLMHVVEDRQHDTEKKNFQRLLGIEHLLACPDSVGIVQLDCRLVGFMIDNDENDAPFPTTRTGIASSTASSTIGSSPGSSSSSSTSISSTNNITMHTLVTKVCIKCSLNMVVDRNNITSCPGHCPPLIANNDDIMLDGTNVLPWKWSYRTGVIILRDTHSRQSILQNIRVHHEMVQHLIVGIPPLALVRNTKESRDYYTSTNIYPWKVAQKTYEALQNPGSCNVRVQLKCSAMLDQNDQLMHNGRDYELISFEVL